MSNSNQAVSARAATSTWRLIGYGIQKTRSRSTISPTSSDRGARSKTLFRSKRRRRNSPPSRATACGNCGCGMTGSRTPPTGSCARPIPWSAYSNAPIATPASRAGWLAGWRMHGVTSGRINPAPQFGWQAALNVAAQAMAELTAEPAAFRDQSSRVSSATGSR